MSPDMHQYMKAKYGNLPTVEVTEEEFVRIMMESGQTEEKAKSQASFAKALGSSVMVGDKMLYIKEKQNETPKD
jgi:hypothetical protein